MGLDVQQVSNIMGQIANIEDVNNRFSTGNAVINSQDHRHRFITWKRDQFNRETLCGLTEEMQIILELMTNTEDDYFITQDEIAKRFSEKFKQPYSNINSLIWKQLSSKEGLKFQDMATILENELEASAVIPQKQQNMMLVLRTAIRDGVSLVSGGLQKVASDNGLNETAFLNLYFELEKQINFPVQYEEHTPQFPNILEEFSLKFKFEPQINSNKVDLSDTGNSMKEVYRRVEQGLFPVASLTTKERAVIQVLLEAIATQGKCPKHSEIASMLKINTMQVSDCISVLANRDLSKPLFTDSKAVIPSFDGRFILLNMVNQGIDSKLIEELDIELKYAFEIMTTIENGAYLSENDLKNRWKAKFGKNIHRTDLIKALLEKLS